MQHHHKAIGKVCQMNGPGLVGLAEGGLHAKRDRRVPSGPSGPQRETRSRGPGINGFFVFVLN